MSAPTRVAVVDLGSNTTRLLIADVADGAVHEIERRTEITRLAEGVDASGRLGDAPVDRVLEVVAGFRQAIDRHGATALTAIATSAVRDAANGSEFLRTLEERFEIAARLIPGDEEARLTFRGATSARPADSGQVLVIDIGGGSTEYTVGSPGREPDFCVSTQVGSVRQTERFIHDDPPTPVQLEALAEEILLLVRDQVPARVRADTDSGIAVAGTATSLAAISLGLERYDPARVDGFTLALAEVERIAAMLAERPLRQRREVVGLHPDRAPTIVAGATILVESIRAFELDAVEVSEADILNGAALELAGAA